MKRILAGGKQKLDKMQMQQEEKQDRKKQTGPTERNEGGKEANRNCHRKGMKARKETKGKQGKTGKDQTTITP
jgi:hypothetical protein